MIKQHLGISPEDPKGECPQFEHDRDFNTALPSCKLKRMNSKLRLAFLMISFFYLPGALAWHEALPDRVNLDVLPVTASSSHYRGSGFGIALEKVNPKTENIFSIQGDLSFPFLQKRQGKPQMFGGPPDWNGALTLLTSVKPTVYVGGKVGASMLVEGGPVGFMALSFRIIPPKDPETWGFFTFATRQLDMGVFANGEIYAVIRLGFQIFRL